MRLRILVAALLAVAVPSLVAQSRATTGQETPSQLIRTAARLLVVTTADWNSVPATLTKYERANDRWQPAGDPVPVVVGKNGMAWDRRIGAERELPGPVKREGDGKSPAGVFTLGKFFGYAPSLAGSARYVGLTTQTECVDDPASTHYAQVLERASVTNVDWKSSEQMRRADELYRWGVIVNYNTANTIAGAGSCIFLHIWSGPDRGTAGCTAMTEASLTALMTWLDTREAAVLVQLPRAEYEKLRPRWNLP